MWHLLSIWILRLSLVSVPVENGFINVSTKIIRRDEPEPASPCRNIRIYATEYCPECETILIAAHHKGLEIEYNYVNRENIPDWLLLQNPEATFPVMEHENEWIIEPSVIQEYLDDAFPHQSILPSEPFMKAKDRLTSLQLEPLCNQIRSATDVTRSEVWFTSNVTNLAKELAYAENLLQTPFYSGESFGLPDIILYPFIRRLHYIRHHLEDHCFLDNCFTLSFPKLGQWYNRMHDALEVPLVKSYNKVS